MEKILPTGVLSNKANQPISAQLICIDVIRMLTPPQLVLLVGSVGTEGWIGFYR